MLNIQILINFKKLKDLLILQNNLLKIQTSILYHWNLNMLFM